MRVARQVARPVLDGVPVHQAGQARVADDVAEALVGALGVGDQVARDELVVKLAQGQLEPLRRVVADDGVRLPDDVERSRCRSSWSMNCSVTRCAPFEAER